MSTRETKEIQTPGESSCMIQDADVHRSYVWSSTFRQFLRYCLVGGVNTVIDLLILNVLLWRFPTNNVQILVVYNSVAYTSGAVSSFFLNKYWTFRRKQRTTWLLVQLSRTSLCASGPLPEGRWMHFKPTNRSAHCGKLPRSPSYWQRHLQSASVRWSR